MSVSTNNLGAALKAAGVKGAKAHEPETPVVVVPPTPSRALYVSHRIAAPRPIETTNPLATATIAAPTAPGEIIASCIADLTTQNIPMPGYGGAKTTILDEADIEHRDQQHNAVRTANALFESMTMAAIRANNPEVAAAAINFLLDTSIRYRKNPHLYNLCMHSASRIVKTLPAGTQLNYLGKVYRLYHIQWEQDRNVGRYSLHDSWDGVLASSRRSLTDFVIPVTLSEEAALNLEELLLHEMRHPAPQTHNVAFTKFAEYCDKYPDKKLDLHRRAQFEHSNIQYLGNPSTPPHYSQQPAYPLAAAFCISERLAAWLGDERNTDTLHTACVLVNIIAATESNPIRTRLAEIARLKLYSDYKDRFARYVDMAFQHHVSDVNSYIPVLAEPIYKLLTPQSTATARFLARCLLHIQTDTNELSLRLRHAIAMALLANKFTVSSESFNGFTVEEKAALATILDPMQKRRDAMPRSVQALIDYVGRINYFRQTHLKSESDPYEAERAIKIAEQLASRITLQEKLAFLNELRSCVSESFHQMHGMQKAAQYIFATKSLQLPALGQPQAEEMLNYIIAELNKPIPTTTDERNLSTYLGEVLLGTLSELLVRKDIHLPNNIGAVLADYCTYLDKDGNRRGENIADHAILCMARAFNRLPEEEKPERLATVNAAYPFIESDLIPDGLTHPQRNAVIWFHYLVAKEVLAAALNIETTKPLPLAFAQHFSFLVRCLNYQNLHRSDDTGLAAQHITRLLERFDVESDAPNYSALHPKLLALAREVHAKIGGCSEEQATRIDESHFEHFTSLLTWVRELASP